MPMLSRGKWIPFWLQRKITTWIAQLPLTSVDVGPLRKAESWCHFMSNYIVAKTIITLCDVLSLAHPLERAVPLSALFRATPSTTIHIFIAIVSAIKRTRLKEANKQELLSLSTSSALLTLPCNFISGISGNTFVRSIPEQSYLFNDCPS